MKFAQSLLLLAGALFACQFSIGVANTVAAAAENESASTSATKTITITMPAEVQAGTVQVILNGKEITSKFSETMCSGEVCETGTLSSTDGLLQGKNVLYAVAKNSDGSLASSRLRFDGKTAPVTKPASRSQMATKVSANLSTTARPSAAVGSSPI